MNGKKLFGEYLLEKGLVGEDALLDVLITQMRQTPSVCEVAREARALTDGQILAALARQTRGNTTFENACRELGCWTAEVDSAVKTRLAQVKIPVGQLLVQEKGVSPEALTHALDAYLAEVGAHEVPAPAPTPSVESVEVPTPAPTPEPEGGHAAELAEQFSPKDRDRILAALEALGASAAGPAPAPLLAEASEILHRVRGAAMFFNAVRMEAFFERLEPVFAHVANGGLPQGAARTEFLARVKEALGAAWTLRSHILKTGGEDGFSASAPDADALLRATTSALEGLRAGNAARAAA